MYSHQHPSIIKTKAEAAYSEPHRMTLNCGFKPRRESAKHCTKLKIISTVKKNPL